MSPRETTRTALVIIRLAVSPMPLDGRQGTYQARSVCSLVEGQALEGQQRRCIGALLSQQVTGTKEVDADLKAVHNLHHAWASKPEGPAAPLVFSAVERMRRASMLSKMIG